MNFIPFGFLLFIFIAHDAGAIPDISNQKNQLVITAKNESYNMINFTEQQSVNHWRITDDAVMGGKSTGRFLVEQGKGIFFGNISLDNNGGFSSVFRMINPLPEDLETVTIDIQGDGLTYQLRMIVSLNGYRLAYKHKVNTIAGKREKLSFALADFQASFRGRNINNAPVLKSEDIREVGFLVTKKTAGKFYLSIFSLIF